jgi:cholesterol 7alpha-monooxygenase/oxysterol 7-alpha-hydroxylase
MVVEFIRRTRESMKNDKAELEKNGTLFKWMPSGLLKFSHHMLYEPSTLALIGDINPASIESDFSLFDKNFHYFFLPLPHWIRSWFLLRELKARSRLNKLWIKNRDPPKSSEFHRDRVELLSSNSEWLSDADFGAILTAFFWASLGNTIPAVFWSLLYILRDEKALETIKQEMDTHLPNVPLDINDNDTLIKDWTPEQLDSCVYLESAINETFRLVGAPFLTRKCIRQTQIVLQDGRTINIQPGETLAWFGGSSHYDANLFSQPTKFVFDRFLNKKAETVPGFMPFGGGKSICPGRFFAKYEIKTCVAMLLRYMEYKLEDTETIPTQIRSRIGAGIAPPSYDIPIMYRYKL